MVLLRGGVGGGGGEANDGTNLGGGEGLYESKVGTTLRFKSLTGSGGIVVSGSGTEVDVDGSGAGGAVPWNQEEWTPTLGQVTFILSQAPSDVTSVVFLVNGIATDDVTEWTISGQTITWLNTYYSLDSNDKVIVRYK